MCLSTPSIPFLHIASNLSPHTIPLNTLVEMKTRLTLRLAEGDFPAGITRRCHSTCACVSDSVVRSGNLWRPFHTENIITTVNGRVKETQILTRAAFLAADKARSFTRPDWLRIGIWPTGYCYTRENRDDVAFCRNLGLCRDVL